MFGIALGTAVWAADGRAAAIVNGSFESGANVPAPGTFRTLDVGATDATGWTVIGSNVDWSAAGPASDGQLFLDLNGNQGPGGVSQVIGTVAGQVYRLSFDMNANANDQSPKTMQVSAGGVSQTYTYDPAAYTGQPWITETLDFTGAGDTATLSFVSTSVASAFYGPELDAVSILAIPAPLGAVWLVAPLGMGARLRRRAG